MSLPLSKNIFRFSPDTFGGTEAFTYTGEGELGGKAEGLAFIQENNIPSFTHNLFPLITVHIPKLAVITNNYFDRQSVVTETQFVKQEKLRSCLKIKINARERMGVILK